MNIYNKIVALLSEHQVNFKVIEHLAEGRTEHISIIRGNTPEQAAKAMVLQVISAAKQLSYVLAIVPGDSKVNFKAVAKRIGGKKSSFAPPEVAQSLTQCVMGAVPPFCFDSQLILLVDKRIASVDTLFFNAGELNKSISMDVNDYFRVVGEDCIGEFSTSMMANT